MDHFFWHCFVFACSMYLISLSISASFSSTALWAALNSARSIKIFGSLSDWAKVAMLPSVCPVTLDLLGDPVFVGSGSACVSAGPCTAPATVLSVARGGGLAGAALAPDRV